MSLTCALGGSAWDVVKYVRNRIEDPTPPFLVPDTAFQYYIEATAEEFSRLLPLEEQIGNPFLNTSTFNTVANTQRYVCNSTNGFVVAPVKISAVLWRSTAIYTNLGSDLSYLAFSPASPVNAFSTDWLDTPSFRVLRSEYLTELEKFGRGTYGVVRDRATGLLAIDLYPVPSVITQVFVRYTAQYVDTGTPGTASIYATIPEDCKFHFGNLLLAEVMDQEADRLAKTTHGQAGFLQMTGSPKELRASAQEMRERVYLALEMYSGSVVLS